jgi:hypothetical protein
MFPISIACFPPCFQWQKNSLKSRIAAAAVFCTGREQLAARFEERLAQQPNFYQKLYQL